MAPDGRSTEQSLIERLEATPYRFDFYSVARRFECMNPDMPRLGRAPKPDQDPIRFGQEPSLAFPPAALSTFKKNTASGKPKLLVNFMGLLGPNGPMPLHITQYIRDRLHNAKDPTIASFLDIFHHRAMSLFYRAWADCQPAVSRDRADDDRLADYISSLIGLGFDSQKNRDLVDDDAKRYYAGRLSLQTHNAEGLEAILNDYFDVDVRIEQFIGHWVELPPEYRCQLGVSPETGTLGQSTLVGTRYWDVSQKFRIVLGPMSIEKYQRFLPINQSFKRLRDWVRNYIGLHLKWDVQMILLPRQVPPLQLGQSGRLGWTTWLTTHGFEQPVDHLILQPPPD
ncbi:MAG: type VI secretion system baseplate subunit TssG [Planctomycetota bacterium]|nr:type VI secretion system baseplate subunit TssG [Planctomycetota bacterium]